MNSNQALMIEIAKIKLLLLKASNTPYVIDGWIAKDTVMRFFGYCDNQLRHFEKEYKVEVSKIGRRKFYSLKSISSVLEQYMVK